MHAASYDRVVLVFLGLKIFYRYNICIVHSSIYAQQSNQYARCLMRPCRACFGPKYFWTTNISGTRIFLLNKFFWTEFFVLKIFVIVFSLKFSGPRLLLPKNDQVDYLTIRYLESSRN